jgi:hypothetical protein
LSCLVLSWLVLSGLVVSCLVLSQQPPPPHPLHQHKKYLW